LSWIGKKIKDFEVTFRHLYYVTHLKQPERPEFCPRLEFEKVRSFFFSLIALQQRKNVAKLDHILFYKMRDLEWSEIISNFKRENENFDFWS
jgi:hypothetical protein